MKKSHRLLVLFILSVLLCAFLSVPGYAEDVANTPQDGESGTIGSYVASILAIHSIEDAVAFVTTFPQTVMIVLVIFGLVLAFFGYRLFKLAVSLLGFAAGWTLGSIGYDFALSQELIPNPESLPEFTPLIACAVCAVILAFIASRLLTFGIFLASAAGTYFFLTGVSAFNSLVDSIVAEEGELKYILGRLLAALLVGLLSLIFTKLIMILATSAVGGAITGVTGATLLGMTDNTTVITGISLVIIVIGVIVQFRTGRRRDR